MHCYLGTFGLGGNFGNCRKIRGYPIMSRTYRREKRDDFKSYKERKEAKREKRNKRRGKKC